MKRLMHAVSAILSSVLNWKTGSSCRKLYLWPSLNLLAEAARFCAEISCHQPQEPLNNQSLNSSKAWILHPPCMLSPFVTKSADGFHDQKVQLWSHTLPVVRVMILEVQALLFVEMLSGRASSLQCFQTVACYESGLEQLILKLKYRKNQVNFANLKTVFCVPPILLTLFMDPITG